MNILVIGATGGSGRAACEALLTRGHTVTALARRATALPAAAGLVRIDADATDPATVERVLPGHDAVIVILGISEPALRVRLRGPVGTPADVRSRATAEIIRVARAHGVRRVIVQSSYGVGETRDRLGLVDRILFALLIKPQIFDTELQESMLRGSELDWTFVQPVHLTDDGSAEHFTSTDGSTRRHKVTRKGVAQVHADLLERPDLIGRTVSVSG
ncbi:NAD(P)-dependent oxidoreductase [Microbacterium kyungheense]|uniref:Putative NADH-flavin reductase n=1 Tax=Microbacterium kyungheense TaxID=1263636 RepID=A0A543FLI3_9MICO|nr:NAD(P)-binding oxidoreductase [Microbacterium kyungheense]TQM34727.1 putative NADH-flavin reductase [Microbacterium kyungheense]